MIPAEELYGALIAPFARELAGKRRLLIAPDGALHSLAFDALVSSAPGDVSAATAASARPAGPDYRAAHYLIDSFEVEYLPSPAFLKARDDRARTGRLDAMHLLAIGYGAASSSSAEISALREVLAAGAFHFARLYASDGERGASARMPGFGIVHFAVHATADTHDPLASHPGADGRLARRRLSARRGRSPPRARTAALVVLKRV